MPETSFLKTIPWKESRTMIIICAVVFASLLIVRITVPRPVKEARNIEKRKAEGKAITPEAYVPVWLYKGLQLNLFLAGGLLLASPWLGRRRRAETRYLDAPERSPLHRWEIIACVALMGFGAWQNSPRLFHSMWGDEEFNASRFILDRAQRQPDGSLKIEAASWVTTLWNMRKPTNHLGYSAMARLSHDLFFEKKTGPTDPWFSEALLRAPVFIAGLLLIPFLFWALRVWGLNPWWALFLLVLHPWFVRFGVDGRGYGFVMLSAAALMGVAGRALQTGLWRWWLLFGIGGFFSIWCNLQGLYTVAALHLLVFVSLWSRSLTKEARAVLASRWLVSGLITAMLMVGYLAPCLPQFQEFIAKREIGGDLDWRFWKDGLCAWWFGQPWHSWEESDNPLRYSMEITMGDVIWEEVAMLVFFMSAVVFGIIQLARDSRRRALLVFTLGAPALMLLHMQVTDNRPYDWYFCPFIPGFCTMMAAVPLSSYLQNRKRVSFTLICLIIALFGFITRHPRQLLRENPLEASRESVAFYRTVTNARNPDIDKGIMSAGITMFTEGYDPALHRLKDAAELRALMEQADREGKQLYLNVGFMKFLRISPPTAEWCAILEDNTKFEHMKTFWGMLPYTTRDVYRYRGKHP